MFYYYGRKKKIARHYPDPVHPTIVEPFAGSAAYSLHGRRWTKKVILVEKDPEVAALWRWLVEEASAEDILALPDPVLGEPTSLFLHILHMAFLHILHMASKRSFTYRRATATPFMLSAWASSKSYMAKNVHKVKHWTILEGDFTSAPDVEATWFVDPPYQGEAGTGYRFGSDSMDYDLLRQWISDRKGALIVCEGRDASWLPFRPFARVFTAAGKSHDEMVYLRGVTDDPIGELFGSSSSVPSMKSPG